jgi:FdrA protein
MTVQRSTVRAGRYLDSVVLMRLQRSLAGLPGVVDAGAVMATPANLELLAAGGLDPGDETAASPDDLLVVVRAESADAADDAIARLDELLRVRAAVADDLPRTRSLRTAVQRLPEAGWVLVSIPGSHAARVADEALDHHRHVFLFSNNVPVADEVALKRRAAKAGLLVMGPDCGSAILSGVGLGFANRVRRGTIGLVAASGTGLQAVSCRIDAAGSGVSHALGTGGRDLSAEVGGATSMQGLDLLDRDPETDVIVLISKPTDDDVAAALLNRARFAAKPVVACFLGASASARRVGNLHFAFGLDDAADLAVELAAAGVTGAAEAEPTADRRYLRGLFSGGTLAFEALLALGRLLPEIHSNLRSGGAAPLSDPARSTGHTLVDLGADELTAGRPHPMIDPQPVIERLRHEADDPEVAVVLLDVVLGDGVHPEPGALLAPEIDAAVSRGVEVIAVVVGAEDDPQDLTVQVEQLEAAGARVHRRLDDALSAVVDRLEGAPPPLPGRQVPLDALARPAVINVGLELFRDSLAARGVEVLQVDWRPPAGGDERLAGILEGMRKGG